MFLQSLLLPLSLLSSPQGPSTKPLCLWSNGPTQSLAYYPPHPRRSRDYHKPWTERWSLARVTGKALQTHSQQMASLVLSVSSSFSFHQQLSVVFVWAIDEWKGLPSKLSGKELASQYRRCRFNPWEGSLEKEMETHSSILAWKITWTEDDGRIQSVYRVAKSRIWMSH